MTNKGVVIAVLALAIAVGTYFVLEQMYPHEVEEVKIDSGVTVEEVFSGTLQPAPATEVASAPVEPAAPAPAEPGAIEPAPAPVEPGATEPAAMEPATEPAEPAPAALEPEPEPTPEPEPIEPEPAPAPKATPPPAPVIEPAPAPAKPKAPPAKPKATPAKPAAPAKPWWGPERADRLSLVYAGSAAYKRALVLMFNGTFDNTTSARANLQVLDGAGKPVAGAWELGASNKRMLLFPVKKAGAYTVVIKPALADNKGRTVAAPMQGPVQVQ